MIKMIINYRFISAIVMIAGVIGKMHEVFVEEMLSNPVGGLMKVIGICILVWFVLTPNSDLQAKDC